MKYLGTHLKREAFYLDLNSNYQEKLPDGNWVCFAIANEEPDEKQLEEFIRTSIKKDLFDFKGQGKFGGFLHLTFDLTMVQMEVSENHYEIEIMTTGDNETDLANGLWECYYITCLPDRADYDSIKVICVSFDQNDYSTDIEIFIRKFNENWLPPD